jgi:superfamily I DNA and/or RNA helicase
MLESTNLLPLIRSGAIRALLVGDNQQLPPVATSPAGSTHSFANKTLFKRLSTFPPTSSSSSSSSSSSPPPPPPPSSSSSSSLSSSSSSTTSSLSPNNNKTEPVPSVLLKKQYRCHPRISILSNKLFYNNRLVDGVDEQDRLPLLPNFPVLSIIDSSGLFCFFTFSYMYFKYMICMCIIDCILCMYVYVYIYIYIVCVYSASSCWCFRSH